MASGEREQSIARRNDSVSSERALGPRESSGRLQPRQLRLEREAQLGAFIVGQPVRHLRKNGAIERNTRRLLGERLRKNFVQP
jgi:hypothetical protein